MIGLLRAQTPNKLTNESYQTIIKTTIDDDNCNWGRIETITAFVAFTYKSAPEIDSTEIRESVIDHIANETNVWITKNGGWVDGFAAHTGRSGTPNIGFIFSDTDLYVDE